MSSICVQQQPNISFGMPTAYAVDFNAPADPLLIHCITNKLIFDH